MRGGLGLGTNIHLQKRYSYLHSGRCMRTPTHAHSQTQPSPCSLPSRPPSFPPYSFPVSHSLYLSLSLSLYMYISFYPSLSLSISISLYLCRSPCFLSFFLFLSLSLSLSLFLCIYLSLPHSRYFIEGMSHTLPCACCKNVRKHAPTAELCRRCTDMYACALCLHARPRACTRCRNRCKFRCTEITPHAAFWGVGSLGQLKIHSV